MEGVEGVGGGPSKLASSQMAACWSPEFWGFLGDCSGGWAGLTALTHKIKGCLSACNLDSEVGSAKSSL